jgi:hypothetical protein
MAIVWDSHGNAAFEFEATAGTTLVPAADGTLVTPHHLCPDMLSYANIGPADGLRGRVVRAFFWVMRLWPPKR